MLGKKQILMMLIVIVSISAISAVTAAQDNISSDEDTISDFNDLEKISVEDETAENTNVLASGEESSLSQSDSGDILSAQNTPYTAYSIDLKDSYEISSSSKGKISIYVTPCTNKNYNSYNFKLVGADKDWNVVYDSGLKYRDTDSSRTAKSYVVTIPKETFIPGTYNLVALNNGDNKVMDVATLKVSGNAVITSSDYSAYYNSGKTMTAKLTDQITGKPLNGVDVKVVFTKGKSTTTKTYTTNSNGLITITPPSAVGTYSVTISSATPHVTATTIKKTATVKKAPVKVKAYKVSEYKGFKITLKAKVTSQGKKVNEGTVKFKINGKTYKAKVKKGVATKKIKLKKVKKYTYTAKFTSSNYKSPKAAKSKATIKKRVATKIVVKNQRVYMDDTKFFTVKMLTKSGKKVKNGKIKIVGQDSTEVKNGKAKFVKYGGGIKHLKKIKGRTEYYRKTMTKTFKLKYIPKTHKYKSSTKKVKVTSVFKCPGCGKKSTHNHYAVGYYVVYKTRIVVS